MSGGGKQGIFNNLERALSTDLNRLQLFMQADRAEILRFLMDVGMGTDDLDAGAVLSQTSTLTTPLTAEIINGFCVRPQTGSLQLAVDQGVMMAIAPDSDADSSNYKYIRDPGLVTGNIAMTGNVSGSTRIDVIECQYNSTTPETDNRDIFNPATGTFAATSVSKATQAGLTYRVRTGTPGGGYPGAASGWLPLCVASVPNGSTTCDNMYFWDVRPLISDRVFSPFGLSREMPLWCPSNAITVRVSAGLSLCTGHVLVTPTDQVTPAYGLRKLGGRLRTGSATPDVPATGVDGLDLNAAANQATVAANGQNYLYLLEPFGLPRWARYTDATTGSRKPRSPRGIPVVSSTVPVHQYGAPSSAIALPAATGLGSSTSMGVAILALVTSGTQPQGATLSGRKAYIDMTTTNPAWTAQRNATSQTGPTAGIWTVTFTLNEASLFNVPPFARSLDVVLTIQAGGTVTQPANFSIQYAVVQDAATSANLSTSAMTVRSSNADGAANLMCARFTIPWSADYAHGVAAAQRKLVVQGAVSNWTAFGGTTPFLVVESWEQY